jgi:hypothetical protein
VRSQSAWIVAVFRLGIARVQDFFALRIVRNLFA